MVWRYYYAIIGKYFCSSVAHSQAAAGKWWSKKQESDGFISAGCPGQPNWHTAEEARKECLHNLDTWRKIAAGLVTETDWAASETLACQATGAGRAVGELGRETGDWRPVDVTLDSDVTPQPITGCHMIQWPIRAQRWGSHCAMAAPQRRFMWLGGSRVLLDPVPVQNFTTTQLLLTKTRCDTN